MAACGFCKDTKHIDGGVWSSKRPCPCCSDSGTPDLDFKLGIRYAAGIDKDGRLVRPLSECLNSNGTVRTRPY